MKKFLKEKLTFEYHIYMVQLGCIALAALICAIVSISVDISSQVKIIADNLLTTSNTLSTGPTIIDSVKLGYATEDCKTFLEELINDMPIVDSITLVDRSGTIIYNSDPEYMGRQASELEMQLMEDGDDYMDTRKDDRNRRYRISYSVIKDTDGNRLGFVAVSILYRRQFSTILKSAPIYILATIILLGIGTLCATASMRFIRSQLKGYDPEQFSQIYDGNANVLNIIDEGVIAINTEKRITIINNMGCEILGLPIIPYDRVPIQDVMPESKLPQVLETRQAIYNEHMILHGKNLLIPPLPLYSNGQLIGAASLFQNAKLINEMTEQLEDANNMVDTLRAFNHEFMNKLHVILGYLETDHIAEAKEYLLQSSMGSSRSISQISRLITHQGVAAIIIGKAIRAAELDIALNLVPESYCTHLTIGIPSNAYVTILGNLIQNAIEELNSCDHILKEIQLTVFIDTESTYISVLDTGRGMSAELVNRVTEPGISTKGPGHGTGLYLVKSLVDEFHGSLKIESDPGEGTEATVMIRKIQTETEISS